MFRDKIIKTVKLPTGVICHQYKSGKIKVINVK